MHKLFMHSSNVKRDMSIYIFVFIYLKILGTFTVIIICAEHNDWF